MTPPQRWLPSARAIRIALACICVVIGLLLTTLFIHQLVFPVLAIFVPQLRTTFYDLAVYGGAPAKTYYSFDSQSLEISVLQWHDRCDDGGQIVIGPYGDWWETPGPMILDSRGNLIWTTRDYDVVTNVQIQEYRGEQFITFWAGTKEGAKGKGAMYMLNSKYDIVHKVQAVGEGLWADLHEFQLTNDGTALMTVYNDTTIDMRDFGFFRGEHGWVTDCLFQEIDIETGELLFQWVASENVRPADTHYVQPTAGFRESEPFDFFHINSIEKDSKGNYLISSRHFHTITYIEGDTGNTIWTLGADSGDFVDISESPGAATGFSWSHHARWLDEEKGLLTLFDNGNAGPLHRDHLARGLLLELDQEKRTVKLVHDFTALYGVRTNSQGNLQYLPEKDEVFMGWGGSAVWTQHDLDGTLLCEVHYSPALLYWMEKLKSYRIFKVWGWKGDPQWPPSATIHEGKLYGSWNGATEVQSWRVEGRREDEDDLGNFEELVTVGKQGFETAIELPQEGYSRFRLIALDADNNVLGQSDPVEPEDPESPVPIILGACAGVLFIVGFVYMLRYLLQRKDSLPAIFPWRRRARWSEYEYSKL